MNELKPCPFCGYEANLSNETIKREDGKKFWSIECPNCGVILDRVIRGEVIEAWNRRTGN